MKKLLSTLLIIVILMASIQVVHAEEILDEEYIINIEDIPYEDYIMYPLFNSPGLPYVIEPEFAMWLVFNNIFVMLRRI